MISSVNIRLEKGTTFDHHTSGQSKSSFVSINSKGFDSSVYFFVYDLDTLDALIATLHTVREKQAQIETPEETAA